MSYGDIIRRAWRVTWHHKVLWIFGILLALTGGGGGGGTGWNAGSGGNRGQPFGAVPPVPELPWLSPGAIAAIVILCCCLLLILIILSIIVRYVAKTALYRMVDHIEETGSSPKWRQGFRLGWSNRAFRLFLLELIVGIVVFLAVLVLLIPAAMPLLLLLIDNIGARVVGIGLSVLLFLALILVLIIAGTAVSVLTQFWGREVVLADRSIGQSLASGYHLVRERLKDVFVIWVIMFVIGLVFAIVLIPIVFALVFAGMGIGAGLGYAAYAITDSVPVAVLAGLPLFMLIMFIPLSLISGVFLVFESAVWTLTYRNVTTVGSPATAGSGVAQAPPVAEHPSPHTSGGIETEV